MVHVITDLDVGGVEVNLLRLIEATREQISHAVISLKGEGALAGQMRALDVPVESLHMRAGFPNPFALLRCSVRVRDFQPHLVHTWMYHANLIGGIAARMVGAHRVVWGIHHGERSPRTGWRTSLTVWAGARLSSWLPLVVICSANSTREVHRGMGYPGEKMAVIFNGYDLDSFSPDERAGARLRDELGIPAQAFVFGMAARVHPDKDPENFLAAAYEVQKEYGDVRFVWCGEGAQPDNRKLWGQLARYGMEDRFHLIGVQADMPSVYNAMDVLVSSSRSEALPNTIGEAMACGRPCVATDVGDVTFLLGDAGRTVPACDPQALTSAMLELRRMPSEERQALGHKARRRIASDFDLAGFARKHVELYRKLAE